MKAFMMMYTLNSKLPKFPAYGPSSFQVRHTTASNVEIGVAVGLVAAIQGVSPDDILTPSRNQARIALARQLAMYMTHVALGCSLTTTGRLFKRHRTTVSHACGRIEDMRDDKKFDQALNTLEAVLHFAAVDRSNIVDRSVQ